MLGKVGRVTIGEDDLIVEIAFSHAEGEDRNKAIRFKGENASGIFNVFFLRHALEAGCAHGAAQSERIVLDAFGDIGLDQGIAAVPGLVGHRIMIYAAREALDGLAPLRVIEHNFFHFRFTLRQGQAQHSGQPKDEQGCPEHGEERSRHLRRRETIRSHAHHTNACF